MNPERRPNTCEWTDGEKDRLTQMTKDQIEREKEDSSTKISWSAHWKRVSSRLKSEGFDRTPGACREQWKRIFVELHDHQTMTSVEGGCQDERIPASVSINADTSNSNKRRLMEKHPSPPPKKTCNQHAPKASGDNSGLEQFSWHDEQTGHNAEEITAIVVEVEPETTASRPDSNSITEAGHSLTEASQTPGIPSTTPNNAFQVEWVSKVTGEIEEAIRLVDDAITIGNKRVSQLDREIDVLDKRNRKDLEVRDAAMKRIAEDYETTSQSLNFKMSELQEAKKGEIYKLNTKAKEGSNWTKLWADYSKILQTLKALNA